MTLYLVVAATLLASTSLAQARCNDFGNCYYGSGGSVFGNNSNTGSSWQSRSGSGGTTFGTDSHGNSWSYNRNSGSYYNYGTGETRYRGQR
jgi:hypothetical protein